MMVRLSRFLRLRQPARRQAAGFRPRLERLEDRLAPATLPGGFTETLIASGLSSPTAMQFSPDGRLFVAQQGGQLRVIQNGSLLPTPAITLTVNSSGERGLLGIAFDPNFSGNQFIYLYYTATTPAVHNRVSRFTVSGNTINPGTEVPILDLENLSGATNHNGGAIHFGPDGKLYVAVGDNANSALSQSLTSRFGKVLRLNSDGTIPADNPATISGIAGSTAGIYRAIWAAGLRNPFSFAFQPGTSRMYINDVGQSAWEEFSQGAAGANYGWPTTEGPFNQSSFPQFTHPLYWYPHGSGTSAGFSIIGSTFYNPTTAQFPSGYTGLYFFGDYVNQWIRTFDPNNSTSAVFATSTGSTGTLNSLVDVKVAADGSLWYLARGNGGRVYRVNYPPGQTPPSITTHPASVTVPVGGSATFTVAATGSAPLSYQWQRNGVNIAGATATSYTLTNAQTSDSGAQFRAVVTNSFGSATSNAATLTVTTNQPPTATITAPPTGTQYTFGQTINFSGTGTDPEDGTLPASNFTWEIVFHHDTHTHPFIAPFSGATGGSFVANFAETDANVFYRIHLTVRDSAGLTHSVFRDVTPRTVQFTLATSPAGLQVTLDGQPRATPAVITGVVGQPRTLGVVSPQTSGGTQYVFQSWSDGGAATHTITTPSAATTYTATYRVNNPPNLAAINDLTVPSSQTVVSVPLTVSDPNGDPVTLSASAQSLARNLDQQYDFFTDGNFYENVYGANEKWVQSSAIGSGWALLLPTGELRAWNGTSGSVGGTALGNVGASYWADPNRLINVPANQPRATLSISGTTLTITRDPAWVSAIVATVTASDGFASTSRTFTVTVTSGNLPPVLQPIADRTVPPSQQVITVPLVATDPDSSTLTFTATGQSLAYNLNNQLGPFSYDPVWNNWGGRQERWLLGSAGQWYFLLANGEFYRWDGSSSATGTLVGNVGSSYYTDPNRIASAPVNQPRATLSISGSTLTITRDPAWVSAMVITVTVSDGLLGDSRTFTVTVV